MPTTFFGIEIARRGLKAHQYAMEITGHNLANASKPGYSRQEAVMKTTNPYTNPSFNSAATPGQFGTGVEVNKIRRIRDEYLDTSVRQSISANGYWQDQVNFLSRAEAVFGEPAVAGMAGQITNFFKSWMSLNNTPQDPGAKAVVIEYGQELAFMMTTAYKQLGDVHESIALIEKGGSVDFNVTRGAMLDQVNHVNELITALQDIETAIAKIYRIGQQPNDLMDKRDMLLEELSHYMPIEVTYNNNPNEGLYGEIKELKLFSGIDHDGTPTGITIMQDGKLLDETKSFYLSVENTALDPDAPPQFEIYVNYGDPQNPNDADRVVSLTQNQDNTSLGGSIIGLEKARQNLLEYQEMLNVLCLEMKEQIAFTMAGKDNLTDDEIESYFFTGSLAQKSFGVNDKLHLNPNELRGERAGEVASLRDEKWAALQNSNFEEYYGMLVSKVGSGVDSVNSMAGNHRLINKQITALRDSVSGVNVDEELTRMIQFQYGFQASSRVVSTMDGMLDVIINRLF